MMLAQLQIMKLKLQLLFNHGVAHSLEAEEAFQALVLFVWAILVMDTASIHHAFAVEELQVRGDEDAIFLKCPAADAFAVLHVRDLAVDILLFEHLRELAQVAIHDESVGLPHGGSQIIICNQLQIIRLPFSSVRISIIELSPLPILSIAFTRLHFAARLALPLFPLVFAVSVALYYDSLFLFLLASILFQITINIWIYDHLSVVEGFNEL